MRKILIAVIALASIGLLVAIALQGMNAGQDPSQGGSAEGGPAGAAGEGSDAGKPSTERTTTASDSDKETSELEVGVTGLAGVRYLEFPEGTQVESPEAAQALVEQRASELGISEPSLLAVVDNSEDGLGNAYYQIEQLYGDLPVYGTSAVLEVYNGQASMLSGIWEEQIDLDPTPTYGAQESLEASVINLSPTRQPVYTIIGEPQLMVYISGLGAHLAWQMRARIFAEGDSEMLIIDAHDPKFLLRVSLEMH